MGAGGIELLGNTSLALVHNATPSSSSSSSSSFVVLPCSMSLVLESESSTSSTMGPRFLVWILNPTTLTFSGAALICAYPGLPILGRPATPMPRLPPPASALSSCNMSATLVPYGNQSTIGMLLPFRLLHPTTDVEVFIWGCSLASVAAGCFFFAPTRTRLPSLEETWIGCPAASTYFAAMGMLYPSAFLSFLSSSPLLSSPSSSEFVLRHHRSQYHPPHMRLVPPRQGYPTGR
jgi:hypothetical protein